MYMYISLSPLYSDVPVLSFSRWTIKFDAVIMARNMKQGCPVFFLCLAKPLYQCYIR